MDKLVVQTLQALQIQDILKELVLQVMAVLKANGEPLSIEYTMLHFEICLCLGEERIKKTKILSTLQEPNLRIPWGTRQMTA